MKVLVRSFLIIPFLFACGGEEVEEETNSEETEIVTEETTEVEEVVNKFDIRPGVVGIFEIGSQVPSLPEELKIRQFTEMDVNDEGKEEEHTHNVVFTQLEDVLDLMMDQGSGEHHEDRLIQEMIILSNYYETAEEVKVGSTIEDFDYTYPENDFWYSPAHDWFFCETTSLEGVQFIIDAESVKKKPQGTSNVAMSMSDFKAGAKIIKIRVN
jgi:hypothetical protein